MISERIHVVFCHLLNGTLSHFYRSRSRSDDMYPLLPSDPARKAPSSLLPTSRIRYLSKYVHCSTHVLWRFLLVFRIIFLTGIDMKSLRGRNSPFINCKPGGQSYSRSDNLVLSHDLSDSYKYQHRTDRMFIEYAHPLYSYFYLRPEECPWSLQAATVPVSPANDGLSLTLLLPPHENCEPHAPEELFIAVRKNLIANLDNYWVQSNR